MPSLAQYRHVVALESGPYVGLEQNDVRATSGSTIAQLVCSQYPVRSGIPQYDLYVDRPFYRPNAQQPSDRHRVVQSYDPSTGTLTPDLAWAISPIAAPGQSAYSALEAYTYGGSGSSVPGVSGGLEMFLYQDLENLGDTGIGEVFEILGPFDVPTLHELINDGLKQCWMVVEVACVPTPGASRHWLGLVAPWLQDPNHVRQAGILAAGEDRNMCDPFERIVYGEIDRDGGDFYFNTGRRTFADGDLLYLRCYKRAYDHCRKSGGTFGEQSGLFLETDEAPIERDWLASSALTVGWRRFGHLLEPAANQRLIRDQSAAALWFADRSRQHFTAVAPTLTFRTPRRFGPVFR
jgi:hypothetical protein